MTFGIRQKLLLGFGILLAVVIGIGTLTMVQIDGLGRAIDVILRENYRSVIACQEMKEALERIDSGVLFTLAGRGADGRGLIAEYAPQFQAALRAELANLTLPGEGDRARRIESLFAQFEAAIPSVVEGSLDREAREIAYFSALLPRFQAIKAEAQAILEMNQANMSAANDAARAKAASAHRRMLIAIFLCLVVAAAFSVLIQGWILKPIRRLTESAEAISAGHYDLVVEPGSADEIGRLSGAFNDMAAGLRRARRNEQMELVRSRRAAEEIFSALPDAVAVLDLNDRVEVATETAQAAFGLRPGVRAQDLGLEWLIPLLRRAQASERAVEPDDGAESIQRFIGGREYFFRPTALPIPVGLRHGEVTGTALILRDVTRTHEQEELKRGVVATVSHQLRTPLTALQMAVHLLLGDAMGPLNERQAELLVAAREEGNRMAGILDDLLDMNRLGAGKAHLDFRPVDPQSLAREGLGPFLTEGRDKGVAFVNAVPAGLPEVLSDSKRLVHVFANLLSNALRFTSPGGAITLQARAEAQEVIFTVEDTGEGIPAEFAGRVFEPFFQVPGREGQQGAGLGLAIVKEIVEAHGGRVGIDLPSGGGSAFWFTLPFAAGGDVPPTAQKES